ncbi:hypothetical protein ACLB2K_045844 [Fragaria x ananassa]
MVVVMRIEERRETRKEKGKREKEREERRKREEEGGGWLKKKLGDGGAELVVLDRGGVVVVNSVMDLHRLRVGCALDVWVHRGDVEIDRATWSGESGSGMDPSNGSETGQLWAWNVGLGLRGE